MRVPFCQSRWNLGARFFIPIRAPPFSAFSHFLTAKRKQGKYGKDQYAGSLSFLSTGRIRGGIRGACNRNVSMGAGWKSLCPQATLASRTLFPGFCKRYGTAHPVCIGFSWCAFRKKVCLEQLHAALAALPDKQAKRIYAHYFLGLNKAEIARSEKVGKATVCASISRGLKKVEKILRNVPEQSEPLA